MDYDNFEFEEMMKRKEIRILEEERLKSSKTRVLKPIEKKLEQSRLFDNSKGVEELEAIFNTLETNSPQQHSNY